MARIFLILLLLHNICCEAASLLILNSVTFEKDANDYAVGDGTTVSHSQNLGLSSAVLRRHKRKTKKEDEKIITKNCTTLASPCSCGWGACHPKKKYRKADDDCCAENHQWKCCEEGPDGQKFEKSTGCPNLNLQKMLIIANLSMLASLLVYYTNL